MEQAAIRQINSDSLVESTANWLKETRRLAEEAGCERAVDAELSKASGTNREFINLGLIGTPNAGKTTVLNELIGRGLLPVSSLASKTGFDLNGRSGSNGELFVVANREWPIVEIGSVLKTMRGEATQVTLQIDCPWMRDAQLRIVEKPALDADDTDVSEAVAEILRNLDLVVLVIDSLAPIKRAESILLQACSQRRLPVIVALAKLDKLPEQEHGVVIPYVTQQVRAYLPDAAIVCTGTAELKETILALRNKIDFKRIRITQIGAALLAGLASISAAASACDAAEQGKRTQIEEQFELKKNKVESEKIAWLRIETELAARCQKVQERVQKHLDENQTALLGELNESLDRSADVKTWWEKDISRMLQRQLRYSTSAIENEIDRMLSTDRRWLQEELKRSFGLQFAFNRDSHINLSQQPPDTRELRLPAQQKLRIVRGLGQAGAVVSATMLLASAGIPGIAVGASILAGVAADQWMYLQTKRNRERVRPELRDIVAHASVKFAEEVRHSLYDWYQNVIKSVKDHQSFWQAAQEEAFRNFVDCGSPSRDWAAIQRQAAKLAEEIKKA
jgi:GTP-binding protein EngB required for normal cell division